MNSTSNKKHLIVLAVLALVCSRLAFALIDDPEGPNLLIVVVLALVIFFPLWGAYKFFKR